MRPAVLPLLCAMLVPLTLASASEPGSPDLGALLAELEASHPRLRAASARIEAAEAGLAPMRALPDPEVRLAYTNEGLRDVTFGETPDASLTVTYEQEMPYPGKRRLGGEVAAAEIEVARAELEVARRALRADLIAGYVEVLRADRTQVVLDASREVLKTLLASARARYESGQGMLEDLLKAQTEITRIEVEVADLAEERAQAQSRLNAALGRPPQTPVPPLRIVPQFVTPPGDAAFDAAAFGAPSVERMRRMEAASASRLDRARLEVKPDWVWGASWAERGSLDPMVMGMVGVRLPLWRKNKQMQQIVAAERDLAAARAATEAEGLEAAAEVGELLATAERARRRIEILEQALIPQARSTLEAGSASYANGRTVFISLLDDALDLLEFERDLERQRADLGVALAGIEARTGVALVLPGRTS